MTYNLTTTPYDELTAADKKKVHKLQLKDQLTEIQAAFKGVLEARAELKIATAKYQNSRDQFSADYINQLIEREKSAANAAYQKYYEKAAKALEKAKEAVLAGHAIIDLTDPRLSNAVAIIQASGSGINYDTAASLVREFTGDQTALRLLQSVFSGVGANMDGGLSKMIYDPEAAFANATAEIRDHMLSADGSINRAARAVAVIAKGENVDFPEQFDSGEIDRAARRGAGLPVESND